MNRVYLDYAATAPLRPEARARMIELLDVFGNPSSVHAEGQMARSVLDESRRTIADILNVRAERIVFTSGGTEANNISLRGFASSSSCKKILISAVEHDCVRNTGKILNAEEIPVDENGVVRLEWLETSLSKGNIGLVSVMHANNENGVIQPVEDIYELCQSVGAAFHTDAVQTVGHMPVDGNYADMLSFAAHKFGGPKGAGVLVLKNELEMQSVITGGSQERNRRAGTENVLAIAGMAEALKSATAKMSVENAQAAAMADMIDTSGLNVSGGNARKAAHVRQVLTPGIRGEDVVIAMDMQGYAVSQGSACGSGRVKESHVLRAMGLDSKAAGEAVRLSWGWDSTPQEVEGALAALRGILGSSR